MSNFLYDALVGQHTNNDAIFLETDQGARISFAQFAQSAAQYAHSLTHAGLNAGDRVVVYAPKLAETLFLYAGAVQAGGVYLPLNTAYTPQELDYFITDAAPTVLICDSASVPKLQATADRVGACILTLDADGSGSLPSSAANQPTQYKTVARGPNDLAALLYTSGTTGRSKGAMLTHNNLASNAKTLTKLWHITDTDRLIHALPVFHTHGLFVALNTSLIAGAKVRLMSKFDLDVIIDELPQSTMLMGVPTFYTRLLNDGRLNAELVRSMRLFISGSAPLLAETHEEFEQVTGQRILERYGMTETNMNTSNPYEGERRAGTVGFSLPGTEVRITDPKTSAELPHGEIGMVEVRGDNVFGGYWNMPEKTAEELREDGFFITGDLGRFDEEGYLQIVGRQKDLIISGGFNIYPKEIEDVLNDIDGITESAVFGVAHPDFGESVVAAIVTDSGEPMDVDGIKVAVSENLARFKHPYRYQFLTELPRNTMGKVQKNLLR
ncbi:MAG: malonyl-CoA synthase [Thalassovita sp.]